MSTARVPEPLLTPLDRRFNHLSLEALMGSIHIWHVPAYHAAADVSHMQAVLSTDEVARAHRFHFHAHRNAFIVNRARLRFLLAQYLACTPAAINFRYGEQGKPVLVDAENHGLTFNLSHTDGLALVAITERRHVGIDVELVRPATEVLEIARQHFSPSEYEQLAALEPSRRLVAFYRCWTRKEALLKAIGEGLHRSLQGFEVTLLEDQPAAVVACAADPTLCRQWRLHALEAGDGYIAALCHDGDLPARPIQNFHWDDRLIV
jgi:4'-phosphopantetheinyl transferase